MALLYSIHLSRHIDGFGKPSVHAVEAAIAGHYRDGKPYQPDRAAIREALPHYYRKAFDRAGGFWFTSTPGTADNKAAHLELRGSRGRYLNTVYAIPYDFQPGEA